MHACLPTTTTQVNWLTRAYGPENMFAQAVQQQCNQTLTYTCSNGWRERMSLLPEVYRAFVPSRPIGKVCVCLHIVWELGIGAMQSPLYPPVQGLTNKWHAQYSIMVAVGACIYWSLLGLDQRRFDCAPWFDLLWTPEWPDLFCLSQKGVLFCLFVCLHSFGLAMAMCCSIG